MPNPAEIVRITDRLLNLERLTPRLMDCRAVKCKLLADSTSPENKTVYFLNVEPFQYCAICRMKFTAIAINTP